MTMDNWVINSNNKIVSRKGWSTFGIANPQIPDGIVRIDSLINHDSGVSQYLFIRYGRKVYLAAATLAELPSPGSWSAFNSATSSSDWVNIGSWKKHTYMVASSYSRPVKVYDNASTTKKLLAAGLDPFLGATSYDSGLPSNAMVTLVNDVQDKMVLHFADTAAHTGGADTVATAFITLANLSNGCTLAAMIAQITEMQNAYRAHITDAVKTTSHRTYHSNSLGDFAGVPNLLLSQLTPPTTLLECAQILTELQKFYNWHVASFRGHPIATIASNLSTATALTGVEPFPTASQDLSKLYTLANSLKASFNGHIDIYPEHFGTYNGGGSFGVDEYLLVPANVNTTSNVITLTAHNMVEGTAFYLVGTVPAPLVANTMYLARSVTTNTFKVGTDLAGATIDITTQGSGTIYLRHARDYNSAVTAADATTQDTLFFLVTNLWAAYRYHNNDLMYDVITLHNGETDYVGSSGADDIRTLSGPAEFIKLAAGMFVGPADFGENSFPQGTQIASFPSSTEILMTYSHDGAGASPDQADYDFSYRKYHKGAWAGDKDDFKLDETFSIQEMYSNPDALMSGIIDLSTKFNTHQASSTAHGIGNLTPVLPALYDLSVYSYLYSFLYRTKYTNFDGLTFIDRGYALEKRVWQTTPVEESPIVFTNITSLTTGDTSTPTHQDTANSFTEVYRTITNGTQFYLSGAVPYSASVSTFSDALCDKDLQNQEPVYYSGGIIQNEVPPGAKAFHILDGTAFYGYVKLGTLVYENRVMQSIPGNPGAVPADFYVDLRGTVTFISSVANRIIVGTSKKIYRIDGQYNELGQGGMVPEVIHESVGTTYPMSAVKAEEHVFFFGTDGIYATDGYKVMKITEHLTATYKTIVGRSTAGRIQGVYDHVERRIYWCVQRTVASGDHDTLLILDLQFGVRPESTFYTWSGGVDFRPTCVGLQNIILWRGDTRGYFYSYKNAITDTVITDPVYETGATNPSTWKTRAITYDYVSAASAFGNPKVWKYIASMELFTKNNGNISLQLNSINDDQGVSAARALKPIRYRTQYTGVVREERMMPAGGLRCSYKQIQITNATVYITNSTTLGTVTVDRTAHTVTLDVGANSWPTYARSLEIAFAYKNVGAGNVADAYTTWYPITAKSGVILTITDATPTAPNGAALAFILRGVPQDETTQIESFNVNAQFVNGDTQTAYKATETGTN